jgi:hypothetical protein
MIMRRKWTDLQLADAVKSCISAAEVMRTLGVHVGGANYETIKRRIADLKFDTSHWLGCGHLKGKTHNWAPKKPLEELLNRGVRYNTMCLKRRLIREGVMRPACSVCALSEWLSKPIPLELDHIDGDRENNSLENLQLLCPNCHAMTPTYRGRNMRFPHIPPLDDIRRGIEECGGIGEYASKMGYSRETIRGWLKSSRCGPPKVEESIAGYLN